MSTHLSRPNKYGGKTSWQTKHRYNSKTYDRLSIFLPKEYGAIVRGLAEERQMSINEFVLRCIARGYRHV